MAKRFMVLFQSVCSCPESVQTAVRGEVVKPTEREVHGGLNMRDYDSVMLNGA